MSDIVPQQPTPGQGMQPWQAPQYCEYCGTRLSPALYFCPACATPYKHFETVLPAATPMPLSMGDAVGKKAPHVMPLFWTYVGTLTVGIIISLLLFEYDRGQMAELLMTAMMLVVTGVFAAIHWRTLAVQFARIGFLRWEAWAALGLLAPLLAVNWGYHSLLMELFDVEADPGIFGEMGPAVVVLLVCVMPAILEEIAFRGLVQHWLAVAVSPWMAMVLASALFTALHMTIVSAPYLFAVGMLLGWAKWKTGSLYPSMLIHFLHNFVVIEFLFPVG